jgi:hypothetical protein
LETKLKDSVISECFSQSKDELIFRFEIVKESLFIKASLAPELSCLSFPNDFQRARKNSVDLFPEVIGSRVLSIRQFINERSFALLLSDGRILLFKMHANRTNIILFEGGAVTDIFRKNLSADFNLKIESLDRTIDWSFECFKQHVDNLRPLYFTFGKIVWRHLEDQAFEKKSAEEKWEAIQSVLALLRDPSFYISVLEQKPVLTLLETGDVKKVLDNPIDAANEFFYFSTQQYAFLREKQMLLGTLKARAEAGKNYCDKNSQRLDEVLSDSHYKLWADLIMANLHTIKPGVEKAVVKNFHEDSVDVEIKLKKDLSPQKNAELYYKKSKNQHIEIERLQGSIREKQRQINATLEEIAEVEAVAVGNLKALRALAQKLNPGVGKQDATPLPYHEFQFGSFRILVGKNARANDILTFRHGHKDDLWLHAKDVSGSHVLIKYQSEKNFPKDVIEYAASLAAFNSKRKSESLCPVIVTAKKFVRKRKGDPAGAVVVDREDVILVKPHNPNS